MVRRGFSLYSFLLFSGYNGVVPGVFYGSKWTRLSVALFSAKVGELGQRAER